MPTNFQPKQLKLKLDIVEKPENRVHKLTDSNVSLATLAQLLVSQSEKSSSLAFALFIWINKRSALWTMDTVVRAVSASVLPVWVDFTSLKGLPCAPGPATTRRGVLVTNG